MAISKERLEELDTAWNYSVNMDDDEYLDWYSELTDEERECIDAWDEQYAKAVSSIAQQMLEMEQLPKSY